MYMHYIQLNNHSRSSITIYHILSYHYLTSSIPLFVCNSLYHLHPLVEKKKHFENSWTYSYIASPVNMYISYPYMCIIICVMVKTKTWHMVYAHGMSWLHMNPYFHGSMTNDDHPQSIQSNLWRAACGSRRPHSLVPSAGGGHQWTPTD